MASDISAAQMAAAKARLDQMYQQGHYRTQAGVARFFDGLELVEPGVVLDRASAEGSAGDRRSNLQHYWILSRKGPLWRLDQD
jgi:S-adenosyl methyltransferase